MIDGFEQAEFTHAGKTRPLYRAGSGPGVVIMHEIPGLHPTVVEFGRRVVADGFTVFMPDLFGQVMRKMTNGYAVEQMIRACISHEFHVLAARRSSPITDWLRALCRSVHAELGGPGVGAVGMCITGNFALTLMVDDCVMAPVLSQPSLPFPIGAARRRGLHVSDEDLAVVKRRVREEGQCVLGLRFTGDPLVPAERFDRLREELGSGFEAIEIDSSSGNPDGIPRTAHSVLTEDLVDRDGHPTRAALDRTLAFFRERLRPGEPASPTGI